MTKAALICYLAFLGASKTWAADPPSVVVLEMITLPSRFEALHTRLRVGVTLVAETGGWRPASGVPPRCGDPVCAGQIAKEANAEYAIVVDGKYRTGGYDVRVQIWNGHALLVDQGACEDCTASEFVAYVEAMVAPMMAAEKRAVVAAASAVVPPALAHAPTQVAGPRPACDDRAYLLPLGWAAIGVGTSAIVAGYYLVNADGQATGCTEGVCPSAKQTHGGRPMIVGGMAIATFGVGLLGYHQARSNVLFRIGPSSIDFGGRF